jgi:hypothetical protein
MPIKTRNLSGEIFGRLTVHEFAGFKAWVRRAYTTMFVNDHATV